MEIIVRASVGDSTQKGVQEKVADFVQRTSCITVVALTEFVILRVFSPSRIKAQSSEVTWQQLGKTKIMLGVGGCPRTTAWS